MLKLLHVALFLLIQLSFLLPYPAHTADDMPVYHVDVADPRKIDSPEYHKGCVSVTIPSGLLPHRDSVDSAGVRRYQVLINAFKANGVPELVMVRNEEFRTWMISPIPPQESEAIRVIGVEGWSRKRVAEAAMVSLEMARHLAHVEALRQQLTQVRMQVNGFQGRLMRYADNYESRLPANLKVPKGSPMEARSAQMKWLLAQGHRSCSRDYPKYQMALEHKAQVESDLKMAVEKVRARRMEETFQNFDPAYHVPVSAETVLLWFHGMGTHVSSVLSLRSAVIQTMALFRRSDLEGKIWPIGVSLPGHGGPGQADIQTLDQFMAWFDGLVEFYRAQGKKVILAGRSASGTLIMEYAMRHPDKLAGIIPFSHVWPEPSLQIDDDARYMLIGPDKSLNLIADKGLLDWTTGFMVGCSWHCNLHDPALIRRLPPTLMVHSWDDEEYKHEMPDGQWVSSMPKVVRKFDRYVAYLRKENPRIHYVVFHEAWHNIFNTEDTHKARVRAFQILKLFLQDPAVFKPEMLGPGIDPLHIHP